MKKQYFIGMFVLCFFVWVVVVDNAVIPSMDNLTQDVGVFSRYRIKHWKGDGQMDLLKDELLIYAYVNNREKLYYIEHTPRFEATLKNLAPGTAIQLRYKNSFPKFWKKHLYDLRQEGIPFMRYSPIQLIEKQKFIWKFSGIMGGVYLFLIALSLINKPNKK